MRRRGKLCALFLALSVCAPGRAQGLVSPVDRVLVTGVAPAPDVGEGAAYFLPGDLASIGEAAARSAGRARARLSRCRDAFPDATDPASRIAAYELTLEKLSREELAQARLLTERVRLAQAATEDALAARAAPSDRRSAAEIEASELRRQAAVNALMEAEADLALSRELVFAAVEALRRNPSARPTRAALEESARQRADLSRMRPEAAAVLGLSGLRVEARGPGARDVAVSGVVTNSGAAALPMPNLMLTAVDERGFALRTEIVEPARALGVLPGRPQPFAADFAGVPEATVHIVTSLTGRPAPAPERSAAAVCPQSSGEAIGRAFPPPGRRGGG